MPDPRDPAIRVMLLPKDTNAVGTIFGGVILSHLDLAGAAEAIRHTTGRVVTRVIREVEFIAPVYVGDIVSFYARTMRRGNTSVTVDVEVFAERRHCGRGTVKVTEAEIVYVSVDADGNAKPLDLEPDS